MAQCRHDLECAMASFSTEIANIKYLHLGGLYRRLYIDGSMNDGEPHAA
jgi:hypothetical protein